MSVIDAETTQDPGSDLDRGAYRVRVVCRDPAGQIHLDWPAGRIKEAVDGGEGVVWIDILDPGSKGNADAERLLSEVFHFHPLAIEDALSECHLPRVDDWGDYLYMVFHSIDYDAKASAIRLHELDIFLGKNYVITYHIEPLGFLDKDRINIGRDPGNRLRHGADHLLYHFLDLAVAEYIPAIEHLDAVIDAAQEEVFRKPTPKTVQKIFRVKRATLQLHRILGPARELLNRLARDSYDPIADDHRVYFRDVYDHIVRVHDLTETLRDLIGGALDTYLSAISNRTNDIMKTLTIVTVMFMPMSFLAGFFGMNFFGETLEFKTPLPKAALFVGACVTMALTFWAPWYWAKRRGWF